MEKGTPGLNDWMSLRNTVISFLSAMNLIGDLQESRVLCLSSPCKIGITHSVSKTKAGYKTEAGRRQEILWQDHIRRHSGSRRENKSKEEENLWRVRKQGGNGENNKGDGILQL